MELASIELTAITHSLNDLLQKYYVSNVYRIDAETILLRLHHSDLGDRRLVLSSGRGIWITKFNLDTESVKGIIPILRRKLTKGRFDGAEQPAGERVILLKFETFEGTFKLVGEFFSHGNIVLLDQNDTILASLKTLRVRHREIRPGSKYSLPPSKGMDVFSISQKDLTPLADSELEVSRWLARNLSLSKKYIEEVLTRAGVSGSSRGKSLANGSINSIFQNLSEIARLADSNSGQPEVVYEDGKPIDAIPFPFRSYSTHNVEEKSSFIEAVDEVLSRQMMLHSKEEAQGSGRRRLMELDRSLEDQAVARKEAAEGSSHLRQIASKLESSGIVDLGDLPHFASEKDNFTVGISEEIVTITIDGSTFETDRYGSIFSLASKLFNESKKLDRRVHAIEAAQLVLKNQRTELNKEVEEKDSEASNSTPVIARSRAWYEKYRWFVTSEGLLAIGGRDASTNTSIIRRHSASEDLIFHADIHGSPYFVLKDGRAGMAVSIKETAQATVSFSRAWKEGLTAVDSYWVSLGQVKTQAPTGMFMPRGSFMIEGKRNYLHGLEVKIAVGARLSGGELVMMGGHPDGVRKHSLAFVVIVPDNSKVSMVAKKVKSELVKHAGELHSDRMKKLSIDDIVRAMPSGGAKITSSSAGEQQL